MTFFTFKKIERSKIWESLKSLTFLSDKVSFFRCWFLSNNTWKKLENCKMFFLCRATSSRNRIWKVGLRKSKFCFSFFYFFWTILKSNSQTFHDDVKISASSLFGKSSSHFLLVLKIWRLHQTVSFFSNVKSYFRNTFANSNDNIVFKKRNCRKRTKL